MLEIISGLRQWRSHPVVIEPQVDGDVRATLLQRWRESSAPARPSPDENPERDGPTVEPSRDEGVMLAYADDGVIWGRIHEEELIIARDGDPALGPELRWTTLLRLHVFSEHRELRVYRGPETATRGGSNSGRSKFVAVEVGEETSRDRDDRYFDELQLLLGNELRRRPVTVGGVTFSPVQDRAGQWHAPPLGLDLAKSRTAPGHRPGRLLIRNYLRPDASSGMLRLTGSRLLRLEVHERQVSPAGQPNQEV